MWKRSLPLPVAWRLGLRLANRESSALVGLGGSNVLFSRADFPSPGSEIRTFFILGSGGSVNDLKPKHWESIASGFSVGLNSWAFHPFVPNAYALENPRVHALSAQAAAISEGLARPQVSSLEPAVWFFRDKWSVHDAPRIRVPPSLESRHRVYGRIQFPPVSPTSLEPLVRRYLLQDRQELIRPYLLLDNGSTVIRMINLALRCGFQRIVLVGVDLGDRQYFFEENPQIPESLGIGAPPMRIFPGVHGTLSPKDRTAGFTTFLRALSSAAQEVCGAELYVSSPSPRWNGLIPSYF